MCIYSGRKMPTIGNALTIFQRRRRVFGDGYGRPGVSAGSPEASYQHLEICTVSYNRQQFGGPLVNKVREERMRERTRPGQDPEIEHFRVDSNRAYKLI